MREMSPADAFEALRAQFDLRPKDMILIESLLSLSERERDGLIAWMESFAATARAVSGGEAPRASPAPAGPERTVEDEADDIAEEARRAFLEERGIRRGSGAYGPGKSGTA